ncbi:MAG: hypothetical protein V3S82_09655 [Dehalococcoidia bacterium]
MVQDEAGKDKDLEIIMRSILPAVLYRPFMLTLLAALVAFAVMAPIAPVRAATITVTNTDDSGDGSLRQAINAASPGNTIDFSGAVTGTILTSGALLIDKDLTIAGPGAGSLSIEGNGSSRIFSVSSDATVSISGLTITRGNANRGGGIYNTGELTLTDSAVSDNSPSGRLTGGAAYTTPAR